MTTPDIKADDVIYSFVMADKNVKYTLNKSDIVSFIDLL